MSRFCCELGQCESIFGGTISTCLTGNTVWGIVSIKLSPFAKARCFFRGSIVYSSWFFLGTFLTICFRRLALFREICVNWTFLAWRFAFSILEVSGWARLAFSFAASVFTQIAERVREEEILESDSWGVLECFEKTDEIWEKKLLTIVHTKHYHFVSLFHPACKPHIRSNLPSLLWCWHYSRHTLSCYWNHCSRSSFQQHTRCNH